MARFSKDRSWIRQSMILPPGRIDETDYRRRIYSITGFRFGDTTLGGNEALNPPPQYCRFADLKAKRFFRSGDKGKGRYYDEVIGANSVLVHMRFGVPAFNSLTTFLNNSYNADASRLARTGRTGGLGFLLGRVIGFAVSLYFMPLILIGQAVKFLTQKPSTRYYYLKPAMPLYWNALNSMVNTYCSNVGFVGALNPQQYGDELASGLSEQDRVERNRLLPDIYRGDGSIDVYAIATRYQRMANFRLEKIQHIRENAASIGEAKAGMLSTMYENLVTPPSKAMNEYLSDYLSLKPTTVLPSEERSVQTERTPAEDGVEGSADRAVVVTEFSENISTLFGDEAGPDQGFMDFLTDELRDGGQFVTFRVDDPGSISESFSNTTRESDLASAINAMSSGAKNVRFSVANGNVTDGLLGKAVGAIGTFLGDILSGAAHQLGVSGLASLAGNALVDVPKHWDGSTANLPRMQYTMQLRTPYGNEISRFQNLIFPTMALLCGALPLSTGTQSYTSPFLCELYCQGRAQTRLGMIDSLEITRGTSNVGFTQDGKVLGIDISFSVVDMSSVLHMPITSSFSPLDYLTPGGLSKLFASDDSSMGDYMAIMSGLGLTDQIYPLSKLKRNWYRNVLDFNNYFSVSHTTNWIGGWWSARFLSAFANATDRGNPGG